MLKLRKSDNLLFISRDDREIAQLVKQHLNVEVVEVGCKREDFSDYLHYLEELFGGIATLKFRRFKVRKLPCLILEGRKVFEGPTPISKLYELLGFESKPVSTIVEEAQLYEVEAKPVESKCYKCIFFNERRIRCVIYGNIDPLNPPC
ncbi:MAG: hypothetical protein DRJ38_08475 [Thermoprotei archaeon]|nr:MAG: hypothetical protein DRJ38_08475 [Thermoprotei archaeon]